MVKTKSWLDAVKRLAMVAEQDPSPSVEVSTAVGRKWRAIAPLDAIRELLSGKAARVRIEIKRRSPWTLKHFCTLYLESGGHLLLRGYEKRIGVVTGTDGTNVFFHDRDKADRTVTKSFDYLAAKGDAFSRPIDHSIDKGKTWTPCLCEVCEWEELPCK